MIDGISALSIDTSAWTDPAQRAALDSLLTQITGQVNALISSLGTNIQTSATGTRIVLTSPVATPAAGQIGAGDKDWQTLAPSAVWAGTFKYRLIGDGLVAVALIGISGGVNGSSIGTFPPRYRPLLGAVNLNGYQGVQNDFNVLYINTDGTTTCGTQSGLVANPSTIIGVFYAEQ